MKDETHLATRLPAVQRYAEHVNPGFVKLLGTFGFGRAFVRAKGTRVWDHEGREYIDFLAGFGSVNLGHNPPRLLDRMRDFLSDDAMNLVHVGPQVHAADFAHALTRHTGPLTMCLFSNSGSEAVEAGLKLARIATRRTVFLYCQGGFHGLNLGSLSVMGADRMRAPFEPLLTDCTQIPFGDLGPLEDALKKRPIAAFLVEPIQAEAGVIAPPAGYLKQAQDLCRRHGALLVLDEVQTGLGRTGAMFAYEHEDVVPDVLVLGKSLGGSMVPISATLMNRDLHQRAFGSMETFDLHGSTFSGNAFACRTAAAALELLVGEDLVRQSRRKGERMLAKLRTALDGHPLVRGIRGQGLLVGIELGPTGSGVVNRLLPGLVSALSVKVFGQWLSVRLLEKGFLTQPASQQWNVLRLEPPLTVSDEEIDGVAAAIGEILGEYRDLAPLIRDVTERLGRQFLKGFSF
jgi:putrescine aminotransferase